MLEQTFNMGNCSNSMNSLYLEKFRVDDRLVLCFDNKFVSSVSSSSFNETEEKEKGFYLKGFFGADEYTQIIVSVQKCQNNSKANNISNQINF